MNVGNEDQKSGIKKNDLNDFVNYCKKLNLEVIGLMCIPPEGVEPSIYFKQMDDMNKACNFTELSMGMASDFLNASQHNSTFLRIGCSIFGQRI